MSDLVDRLKAACVGHPDAKIPWPHRLLHEAIDELTALRARVAELTEAAQDVLAERKRQIEAEGWTPQHDDEHDDGEMADAAGCYAIFGVSETYQRRPPICWPWDEKWWKPSDHRRNIVKAAALLLAEIERLDRAALAGKQPQEGE